MSDELDVRKNLSDLSFGTIWFLVLRLSYEILRHRQQFRNVLLIGQRKHSSLTDLFHLFHGFNSDRGGGEDRQDTGREREG